MTTGEVRRVTRWISANSSYSTSNKSANTHGSGVAKLQRWSLPSAYEERLSPAKMCEAQPASRAVKLLHPDYHCAPVGPWGVARPRLLIVGLAPGLHGQVVRAKGLSVTPVVLSCFHRSTNTGFPAAQTLKSAFTGRCCYRSSSVYRQKPSFERRKAPV